MRSLLEPLGSFVREFRRRKVFRVGAVYLAVAWLLVQAVTQTFPYLGIPDWTITLVIVLAAAGFPLALLLAWAFEVTPEGVRRSRGAPDEASEPGTEGQPAVKPVANRSAGEPPGRGVPVRIGGVVLLLLAGAGAYALLVEATPIGGGTGSDVSGRRSIAVLPFADLSPEGDQRYLGDGLSEEIIGALGRLRSVEVKARSSSFRFRGESVGSNAIGDSLGVEALLEGSVQRVGDQVRIRTQLVDTRTEGTLWTQSYSRRLGDVLAVQQEIAQKVVDALEVRFGVGERERLSTRPTGSGEAYLLYLRGRHAWNSRTPEALRRSLELYGQALELDPDYADAWAGIADTHVVLASYGLVPAPEAYPRAREAARHALQLDDGSARAHAALGATQADYFWDWERAEEEFRRALELDPDYVTARYWYAEFLAHLGRTDEALAQAGRAQRLDPLSLQASATVGLARYMAGDYRRAVEQLDRTLEEGPQFTAYLYGGLARSQLGEHREAVVLMEEGLERFGSIPTMRALTGYVFARAGEEERARELLEELLEQRESGYVYPIDLAAVQVGLGSREEALRWLDEAYEERNWQMRFLATEPVFAPLRDDPRFQALVEKLDFPR